LLGGPGGPAILCQVQTARPYPPTTPTAKIGISTAVSNRKAAISFFLADRPEVSVVIGNPPRKQSGRKSLTPLRSLPCGAADQNRARDHNWSPPVVWRCRKASSIVPSFNPRGNGPLNLLLKSVCGARGARLLLSGT
jgi:hypothetical protein